MSVEEEKAVLQPTGSGCVHLELPTRAADGFVLLFLVGLTPVRTTIVITHRAALAKVILTLSRCFWCQSTCRMQLRVYLPAVKVQCRVIASVKSLPG